jgi:hypothetical protein
VSVAAIVSLRAAANLVPTDTAQMPAQAVAVPLVPGANAVDNNHMVMAMLSVREASERRISAIRP